MSVRPRVILHVDLDAFFASVEQRDEPQLRGRPVIVGGSMRRGVVLAASYEVRPFGVRSAMPMARAMRLCPHAIVVPPRHERYMEASETFFAVLERFSPLVEGLSIDEAFLDVTGTRDLFGAGDEVGQLIRKQVREEVGLAASVGVANCKFVAKIASDMAKPDGLLVVAPETTRAFLAPLPVERMWGVGQVAAQTLHEAGVHTVGDLAAYEELLVRRIGEHGHHLAQLARGLDEREVESHRGAVSLGSEETFEHDVADRRDLAGALRQHCDRVATRLRSRQLEARCLVLKVKLTSFRVITRRKTMPPCADGFELGKLAAALLEKLRLELPVRLVGIYATDLIAAASQRQLSLDERDRARGRKLGETIDAIHQRFGGDAVQRAEAIATTHPERTPSRRRSLEQRPRK